MTLNGRKMPYLHGPKVDPADTLPDGRAFRDSDDLKQLLLTDPDQLARALTTKLLTYATGHALEPADHSAVRDLAQQIKAKNYGFRSLIHAVVASEMFQSK